MVRGPRDDFLKGMSYLIVGAGGVLAGLMPRLGGWVSLILAFNAVGDDMDYMMSYIF